MPTTNTRTVKSSGGDYTSLSAWEAGRQGDLVSSDCIEIAECYSLEDTTTVDIDGWTTDATRYIKVATTSSARHGGVWSTSAYRMVMDNTYAFTIRESHVWLDGIQITLTNPSAGLYYIRTVGLSNTDTLKISNTIFKGHGNSSYNIGLCPTVVTGSLPTMYVWNSLFYGSGNSENSYFNVTGANDVVYIYNSTFILGGTNVTAGVRREAGTLTCTNVFAGGCYSGRAFFGTITCNYCASSDASADDNGGTGNIINKAIDTDTFVNVTAGSEDYRLATDGLSPLVNAGTSDPGSGLFSDDITYTIRSGTWDIGAHEYVAAGGGFVLPIGHYNFNNARP